MYGLESETICKINRVLAEFDSIEKVILYGSRAMGNYRPGSDIDLTLEGKDITLQTVYALQDKLDDLYLPYNFDISIFNHIDNEDLIDHIRRVGKIFYRKIMI